MLLSHLFEARLAQDVSQAGIEAARRHPDAFIHFTNVRKLGINPGKRHSDAPGIYFYPCRWIINPENLSGFQYGISMEHYYVARLKRGTRVVNLGTMTMIEARRLAEQGGWGAEFTRFVAEPTSLTRGGNNTTKPATRKKAGYLWYGGMDHLANDADGGRAHTWVSMLRGVDAIYDPGHGIVHPDEPAQLIVMRSNLIEIIESGANRDISRSVRGRAMAEAARRLGGTAGWRSGVPFLRATVDGKPVEVEDRDGQDWTYAFRNGVWAAETHRSYSDTDEAGLVDSYMSLARVAAMHADADGRVSRWTPEAVNKLMRMIPLRERMSPLLVKHVGRPLVPEGTLRYGSGAGFGANAWTRITIEPDDTLEFQFGASNGRDDSPFKDFEFVRRFPPDQSPREIAATIGEELTDALMQRVKHLPPKMEDGRDRSEAIRKVFGLVPF